MDTSAIDDVLDTRPQRFRATVGVVCIALACALGAWVFFRGPSPFALDVWWNQLFASSPSQPLLIFSIVMDTVGGHLTAVVIVPVLGALALFLSRRRWSALYFLTASVGSALLVQVVKHTFGRARPEDILIISDYGSFPSGHTANAATIAVVAAVLFPAFWVRIVGVAWVVLMAFSRTYLHAHWLSDTAGGALIGAGAALVLAAAFSRLRARDEDRLAIRKTRESDARASVES
ncbi:membrane-associated phospholipid phosphatase [Microbacterium testaceum]|uniref:phosphatase PAP2 family protein n=1 Tax=Microbacterium TaxID=33882 RepID=UPI0027849F63|nr:MULTISPECIES: phosphatase PAP2 family protein [Microbacterium]MDQ1111405.1 membrane-associated phospholipid phosphatase [Microbacterium testaceum]MDR6098057.1 membrane-associated phospholipid phosphatase [Microbacterium sp. SORGH_AS_0454]